MTQLLRTQTANPSMRRGRPHHRTSRAGQSRLLPIRRAVRHRTFDLVQAAMKRYLPKPRACASPSLTPWLSESILSPHAEVSLFRLRLPPLHFRSLHFRSSRAKHASTQKLLRPCRVRAALPATHVPRRQRSYHLNLHRALAGLYNDSCVFYAAPLYIPATTSALTAPSRASHALPARGDSQPQPCRMKRKCALRALLDDATLARPSVRFPFAYICKPRPSSASPFTAARSPSGTILAPTDIVPQQGYDPRLQLSAASSMQAVNLAPTDSTPVHSTCDPR